MCCRSLRLARSGCPNEDAEHLDTVGLRRRGQLNAPAGAERALERVPPSLIVSLGLLAVVLTFGAWGLLFGGWSAVPWAWFVASLVAVLVAALGGGDLPRVPNAIRASAASRSSSASRAATRGDRSRASDAAAAFARSSTACRCQALEVAVMIGAVVIAAVGLGVAIFQTTQLPTSTCRPRIERCSGSTPRSPRSPTLAAGSPAFSQLLVGHVAQWILVSIAALTPAAMYFQFDRQRLAAVQRCWVQEVFRLDPTVRTVGDIEAKYGSQIEASFGDLGTGLLAAAARRAAITRDRGDDPPRRRLVPDHLDDPRPAARRARRRARRGRAARSR